MERTRSPAILRIFRHGKSLRNDAMEQGSSFITAAGREKLKELSALAGVNYLDDLLVPLTEEGRRQAAQTGHILKARFECPDRVIHSGFARTRQTAEGLLSAWTEEERACIDVFSDERIRERAIGYAYNMTMEEAYAAFPWLPEYWAKTSGYLKTPPGGESMADVVDRTRGLALEFALGLHPGTTWVVSHGNAIRGLRFHFEGLTYDRFEGKSLLWPPNCGMVAYRFGGDGKPERIAENEILYEPKPAG